MKKNVKVIPIFFTFDKNYVLPAAVAFQSLLDNGCSSYQYNLHVLTLDNIPSKEKRKLKNVVDGYPNANLTFRNVERSFDEKWSDVNQAHYSKDIFNKLIPTNIFTEYDWIVCSDVDVVFEGDISDIISFNFLEYCLSGVKSIKEVDQYIERAYDDEFIKEAAKKGVGGGFLVYNLRKIRDRGMEKNILNNLNEYSKELVQPEQDVLNITFKNDKGHLPLRFTSCTYIYSTIREGSFDTLTSGNWWYYMKEKHFSEIESGKNWSATQISEALRNPVQIHYAGGMKPWNTLLCYKKIVWLRYLSKTEYFLEHLVNNEPKNIYRYAKKTLKNILKNIHEYLK